MGLGKRFASFFEKTYFSGNFRSNEKAVTSVIDHSYP